ncbi:RNA-binding domain-containing protein [Conidiobolus coronatus NRRL 28638]|uniref:RNA-binding domain-containing protein n=1 Tax=Conidiobolus coronatus (strain ATCC 28846 / CBS 209.66 / NRRL 28638) TaxID=796925 RepID=A0A137PGC2_CONC2|nr:RNA-binding domain-containing protein [Conidiobolus coronatus NRRL 28638]|eukprot:KXN74025.1 RNA-binding domain-containing protein [Conidiobolus coronatus NRRL 28638]
MMSDRNPEMSDRPHHDDMPPSPRGREVRDEREEQYRDQYRRSYSPRSRSRSRSRSPQYRERYRSRSRSPRRGFREERDRNARYSPQRPQRRNRNEPAPPSKVIGVFGLNLNTRERDLKELFSGYTTVTDISLVYDKKSDQSRGFAFVSFDSLEEATAAKERTNGMELHGRTIRVDYSLTQRAHSPTPGEYMGHRNRRPTRNHYSRRSPSPYYRRRRSPSPYYRRRHRSPSYTRDDRRPPSRSRS